MKNFITGILILVSTLICSQNKIENDSVSLRIYNRGKFYIKELKLTVGENKFVFKDVWKNKYSDFIKVPYIWKNNKIETTVIVKRMFKYDQWFTRIDLPIDHIGEEKIKNGFYTIELKTRLKKKELKVKQKLVNTGKNKKIFISGTIKDETKEAFQYANIIIKNSRTGTIADEKGRYKIDITKFYYQKKKIIISYSFLGYKIVEKEIKKTELKKEKNRVINITLKEKAEAINCNG